jgi:hypothetical protein
MHIRARGHIRLELRIHGTYVQLITLKDTVRINHTFVTFQLTLNN